MIERTAVELVTLHSLEIMRLRKGLTMLVKQEYDRGYTPEDFAQAVLDGDEPVEHAE